RDEWPKQHRENTARFRKVVKHLSETRGLGGVFRQLERRGPVHVLIGASDQRPNALERSLKFRVSKLGYGLLDGLLRFWLQFVVPRRHDAVAVTLEHRERAVDQVAQSIGQLRGITRLETGVGPI